MPHWVFHAVGLRRELKKAQEGYWAGNLTQAELLEAGKSLRARHWQQQKDAGVDLLPVGDFAWYDYVLATSLLLGNVPARHQNTDDKVENTDDKVDIDTLFRISRGRAPTGEPASAAEMTKRRKSWFAFALQKCAELSLLTAALNSGEASVLLWWNTAHRFVRAAPQPRVNNAAVTQRLAAITAQDSQRQHAYPVRAEAQRAGFNLPDNHHWLLPANHGNSWPASGLQARQS
ncbi:MAG: hypothetical protein ACR5LF_07250 [Symbiopectobacterium sp.]